MKNPDTGINTNMWVCVCVYLLTQMKLFPILGTRDDCGGHLGLLGEGVQIYTPSVLE